MVRYCGDNDVWSIPKMSGNGSGGGTGNGPAISPDIMSRLQILINQRVGQGKIDEAGQRLLYDYTQELVRTILEHAVVLAKSKESNKIEGADIAFLLGNFFLKNLS